MVIFQLLFFLASLTAFPLWGSAVTSHATVYFSPEDQLDKRLIEQIEKDTDRDYFMSAEESKNYGIVDQVITTRMEVQKS